MGNGILLLDKEAGYTSRQVDSLVQKAFGVKRVGHLGTLDPFATGLLLVGVGSGTKYLTYLDDGKKSYIASLKLGETTSSFDPETPVIGKKDVPPLDEKTVSSALASFLGKSVQLPPMTSAIKVNGEPLYKAAHKGLEVERTPRQIEVFSINLVKLEKDVIVFSCTVSRGTYIRVIGADLAERLGTIGYLTSLRRLSIGPFLLANAKKISEAKETDLLDPTLCITTMKHVEIDDALLAKVKNGVPMDLDQDYGEKVLLVLHGNAISVYKRFSGAHYLAERGLF